MNVNKYNSKHSASEQLNNGFLLLEILLAIFIIAIFITMLFPVYQTLFTSRTADFREIAAKIARREIENLRKQSSNSLPGTCTNCLSDSDLAKLKNASGSRTVNNCLSPCGNPSPADPNIKEVSVTIDWDNDKGVRQSLTMNTIIYKSGL